MLHSANFCQSRVKWTIEHKKHSYWPPLYLPLSSLGEEISPKKVVCQSKIKLWSRMENVARTSGRQSRLPLVHLPWHSLPNFASLMILCFALSPILNSNSDCIKLGVKSHDDIVRGCAKMLRHGLRDSVIPIRGFSWRRDIFTQLYFCTGLGKIQLSHPTFRAGSYNRGIKFLLTPSVRGGSHRKVYTSSSSLITPDIFKLLGSYESSGYPLSMEVW